MFYINYCFKDIQYDDNTYMGIFENVDNDIKCKFIYNRKTKDIDIWDSNKPIEAIIPLPIHWLDWKLAENGKLNTNESKISY